MQGKLKVQDFKAPLFVSGHTVRVNNRRTVEIDKL